MSISRFQRGLAARPHQIDRDVAAAIAGRGDAPEDQDAEQHAAEVVAVGDLTREELAQQHRDEDVGRDDARRTIAASHSIASMKRSIARSRRTRAMAAPSARRAVYRGRRCTWRRSRLQRRPSTASGSPPALLHASAHCAFSGATALRQAVELLGRQLVDLVAGHRRPSWRGRPYSKSAQGEATFSAHSVVQWSSITFFCAGDMESYLALFIAQMNAVDVERHVHVVLHHLVDAEQEDRAPREGDRVGDAALEHVARLGRRGLHVGAAQQRDHLADRALRRAGPSCP